MSKALSLVISSIDRGLGLRLLALVLARVSWKDETFAKNLQKGTHAWLLTMHASRGHY